MKKLLPLLLLLAVGCNSKTIRHAVEEVDQQLNKPTNFEETSQKETFRAPLEKISEGNVEIAFAVGDLHIGKAENEYFVEANFKYTSKELKQTVKYATANSVAHLTISHEDSLKAKKSSFDFGSTSKDTKKNYEYCTWDVLLNPQVPIDLTVGNGVGKVNLDLGALNVTKFELGNGVGVVNIDFSELQHPISGKIGSGVGKINLVIPSDAPVNIVAESALGDVNINGLEKNEEGAYVNPHYRDKAPLISLEIGSAIGAVNVTLAKGDNK